MAAPGNEIQVSFKVCRLSKFPTLFSIEKNFMKETFISKSVQGSEAEERDTRLKMSALSGDERTRLHEIYKYDFLLFGYDMKKWDF